MPIPKGSSMIVYRQRKSLGLCTQCDEPRLPYGSRCSGCTVLIEPAKVRGYRLKGRYNITSDDFDAMYDDQGGVCAICFRPGVLVIDHCHDTGAVRGLIHSKCNTAIGILGDDPIIMRRAADYLES